LEGKTRLLVTHQIHLLQQCDLIIILENGNVKASGSYTDLYNSGIDITAFIPKNETSNDPVSEEVGEEENGGNNDDDEVVIELQEENINHNIDNIRTYSITSKSSFSVPKNNNNNNNNKDRSISMSSNRDSPTKKKTATATTSKIQDGRSSTLMTTEEKGSGDVGFGVYYHYIKNGGLWCSFAVLVFLILVQASGLLSNFYLTYWGSQSINEKNHGHEMSKNFFLLFLFFLFIVFYLIIIIIIIIIIILILIVFIVIVISIVISIVYNYISHLFLVLFSIRIFKK
jgi:ATP-binding cassette subfamily C (CFTR/MRP) protein 1